MENHEEAIENNLEPKIEELQYKDILDVSIIKKYYDKSIRYFSKVNCFLSIPKAFYYIHIVLTFIQLISPCFLLGSRIIWEENSIPAFILKVIFSLSRGWQTNDNDYARRIITLIVTILICVSIIILELLKHQYYHRPIISNGEATFTMVVYKFILPHFLPLLVCGYPSSIKCLVLKEFSFINFFNAIIAPFAFLYLIVSIHYLSKRVLVENNPSFSWNSNWFTILIMTISFNNLFECTVSSITKINPLDSPQLLLSIENDTGVYKYVFMTLLLVTYLIVGIFLMIFIPFISFVFSFLVSSVCMSCAIVVLVSIISAILDIQMDYISIIIFILLTIIFYFINMGITKKSLFQYTELFNKMNNSSDEENEIFNNFFKRKISFFRAAHIIFSYWDPYFLTWKPFRLALEKWPNNNKIIILWLKMCSIFPHEKLLFQQLLYQNIQNHKISLSIRLQFSFIAHSRINLMIPYLFMLLHSVKKSSINIEKLHRRFFEDILSKNLSYFWGNVNDISRHVKELEITIKQLVDSYPNNQNAIACYCNFLEAQKLDPHALFEWKKKLNILTSGGKLKPDMAYISALSFYPQLSDICSTINSPEYDTTIELINDDNSFDDDENEELNLQFSLYQILKHSKLGNILLACIFIVIGTVFSIICSYFYFSTFQSKMLTTYSSYFDSMSSIDFTLLNTVRLCLYVSQVSFLSWAESDLLSDKSRIMEIITPNLYLVYNSINSWDFNITDAIQIGIKTRSQYEQFQDYFNNIDSDSANLHAIYNSLFVESYKNSTRQTYTIEIINNLLELLIDSPEKILDNDERYINFKSGMKELIPQFLEITNSISGALSEPSYQIMNNIGDLLFLYIAINIFFITIPFLISNFNLERMSIAIASSFFSIPHATVREVILQYSHSKEESSYEETRMEFPSNGRIKPKNCILFVIPFILTFLALIICSLYIYYKAYEMTSFLNDHINTIQVITLPLSQLYYSSYMMTEFYNYKFVYNNKNSDLAEENRDNGQYYARLANINLHSGLYQSSPSLSLIYRYEPEERRWRVSNLLPYTDTEQLIMSRFFGSVDMEVAFLLKFYQFSDSLEPDDPEFLGLSYFLTNYAVNERDDPYILSIFATIGDIFDGQRDISIYIFIFITIFQVLVSFITIISLFYTLLTLRKALHFFLFFKPSSILQNQQIITLLTEGKIKMDDLSNNFKNSEEILLKIPEAIAIIDRNLSIFEFNIEFLKLIDVGNDALNNKSINNISLILDNKITDNNLIQGKRLNEIMLKVNKTENNINSFESKLNDILSGNEDPNFNMLFSFKVPSGKLLYVNASIICLTDTNIAKSQSQSQEITSIAIVIDDLTDQMLYREKIQAEQMQMKNLLEKILPAPVVESFQDGMDSISFGVDSATIGFINVDTDPFDPETPEAPFIFYDSVLKQFDNILSNFPLLTKVRAMFNTYVYASGIFSKHVKPEKHSEEAVRFALSLIGIQPQIEEKLKRRVTITIGIDTGGPIVAGILSIQRPAFQVFGNVNDVAKNLMSNCSGERILVSKNVYDLIYTYNFNLGERGEIELPNKRIIKTYFVNV